MTAPRDRRFVAKLSPLLSPGPFQSIPSNTRPIHSHMLEHCANLRRGQRIFLRELYCVAGSHCCFILQSTAGAHLGPTVGHGAVPKGLKQTEPKPGPALGKQHRFMDKGPCGSKYMRQYAAGRKQSSARGTGLLLHWSGICYTSGCQVPGYSSRLGACSNSLISFLGLFRTRENTYPE